MFTNINVTYYSTCLILWAAFTFQIRDTPLISSSTTSNNENKIDDFEDSKGLALLVGVGNPKIPNYYYPPISKVSETLDDFESVLLRKNFKKENIERIENNPGAKEIIGRIKSITSSLKNNDLFVFYFFGHGDQRTDESGDEIFADKKDEVLIARDREILDDEIGLILKAMNPNIRVVFIIESCHSGTLFKINGDVEYIVNEEIGKNLIDKLGDGLPNFIYMGATADARKKKKGIGAGFYTSLLSSVIKKERRGKSSNYVKFNEKVYERSQNKPVVVSEYATTQFINQRFLQIK